jgi:hypothetical protein
MNKKNKNKSAATPVADNSQNGTAVAETPAKGKVGRPREKFSKVVAFTVKDGVITRRGRGKPSLALEVKYFSVPWDFDGTSLPETATEAKAPKRKVKANKVVESEAIPA